MTQSADGRYRNPTPTVDIIIERPGEPGRVLLIERKNPPHGWALPGGFVDEGETLANAARREAKEETSLDVELLELFHCYSKPDRDPRQHTVSTVFLARSADEPTAADDAGAIGTYGEDDLPALAFDHATILADYFTYRATGKRPPPDR